MAIWTKRSEHQFMLRAVPVTRIVLTLGLAVAFLIPAFLDWEGGNRRTPGSSFWYVLWILAIGFALSPARKLTVDLSSRRLTWQTRRALASRHFDCSIDDLRGARLVGRPRIGPLARLVVELNTATRRLAYPYGWVWRSWLDSDRRETLLALREAIGLEDATADHVLDVAPNARSGWQISLRRVLIATALVAATLAVSRVLPWRTGEMQGPVTTLVAVVLAVTALGYRVGSPMLRRMLPSLVAMYAPMAWVVLEISPRGGLSGFIEGLPIVPALWLIFVPVIRSNHDAMAWSCAVAILLELGIAAGCALRGWRWAIPCTVVLFALSSFASFILNAGIRM
jgi:hypothetical protein